MKFNFKNSLVSLTREIRNHPATYFLLFLILFLALFVRVYRTEGLLRFYFDQGRDALVIWRLLHEGKFFLIGPVTGLDGIFLGPFYYYLIAPLYLLGGGSPVLPVIFLGFTATLAIFMLYYLGRKFHSRTSGIFAATIGAFSYFIVLAGRWLANPTSLLLTSLLLLWSMWEIANKGDKRWWIAIALLIGLSLQLEAASAVFFLPMILVFAVWQRKRLPGKKILFISAGVFFLTLLPQIAFNFRHENILFNNFKRVFLEEKSFSLSFGEVFVERTQFFWSVFQSKINPGWRVYATIFFLLSGAVIFVSRKKLSSNLTLPLLLLFIGTPILGILAFQGNFGNIYDYYMTGVYLPFILLFSIGLGELWKTKSGKFVVSIFFVFFFMENGTLVKNYLTATVETRPITLEDQLGAIDWVFEDAEKQVCPSGECPRHFNVDVYVPPVIPYAYDYLFLWQGTKRCGENLCGMRLGEQVPLLYTLYEVDPPHPERLDVWLDRQKGIGKVEKETNFGGVTVQRRERL